MSAKRYYIFLLAGLLMTIQAQPNQDNAYQSALWILKQTAADNRQIRNQQNTMLRAIRQMHDPKLAPLYEHLKSSSHKNLRIHGMLGLAETGSKSVFTEKGLSTLDTQEAIIQFLDVANESQLIDPDQVESLLKIKSFSTEARLAIILPHVNKKQSSLQDNLVEITNELSKSKSPSSIAMSLLLRVKLKSKSAADINTYLNKLPNYQQKTIKQQLLRMIIKHQIKGTESWLKSIYNEKTDATRERILVVEAAIRTHITIAQPWFNHEINTLPFPSQRYHLSLVALSESQHLPKSFFNEIITHEDELLSAIGTAAGGIRTQDADATKTSLLSLHAENNNLLNRWLISYCTSQPKEVASEINFAILQNTLISKEINSDALANLVFASQAFAESQPTLQQREAFARTIHRYGEASQEAALMGLIRSNSRLSYKLLYRNQTSGIDKAAFKSESAKAMVTIIAARHLEKLNEQQLDQLSLIVRGGTNLQMPLRVQAAWLLLKQTNRDKMALAALTNATQEELHGN